MIENQSVICAELDGMRSARQSRVVGDVVNGDVDQCGSGFSIERADVIEVGKRSLANAAAGIALAREAVMQILDEIGRRVPCISRRKALAVICID
jgi:hypothetical protein